MTQISYKNVHNRFRLNGFHFDREAMQNLAYSYIKEGADFQQPVGNFFLDWFDENPFLSVNTSGTTGTPKKILIDKQAMVNSALATGDFYGLEPGNKVLHCLPTNFIAGKMMFVRAFILGLDIDFVAPNSNPLYNNDTNYDFAAMVPLQANNAIKGLKRIKKLIVGGAQVNSVLEKKLQKLPTVVYETYGMTETITHIAAKRVGEKAFTVLPNVTIKQDANNCLVIYAPRISSEAISTSDLVELINEKQFVFLGRFDTIINSGGIKLIPEEIEAKLSEFIALRFFISSKKDKDLGEKLILVIEGEKFDVDSSIFNVLDKYEKPKEIVFIPKFKETETGKLLRKESLK